MYATCTEQTLVSSVKDVKALSQWLFHDVIELAWPPLSVREELFDFIVAELQQWECKAHPKVRALRKVLQNQRDQLLAFAGVLDQKLVQIFDHFEMPLRTIRDVCLLHRK